MALWPHLALGFCPKYDGSVMGHGLSNNKSGPFVSCTRRRRVRLRLSARPPPCNWYRRWSSSRVEHMMSSNGDSKRTIMCRSVWLRRRAKASLCLCNPVIQHLDSSLPRVTISLCLQDCNFITALVCPVVVFFVV